MTVKECRSYCAAVSIRYSTGYKQGNNYRKAKNMLELEYIDKCLELFHNGKINGSELAELLLKKREVK